MVSKAHNQREGQDQQATREDQLEHAINSTRQLQTTNIQHRTAVHKALAELSEPIYAYLGIKNTFTGGARLASRGEASGAEGGAEALNDEPDRSSLNAGSMLTNAAFATGMGAQPGVVSGGLGESTGPAERAFEGEDSKNKQSVDAGDMADLAVATHEAEPLSVFSYVAMASGVDVKHFGMEPTIRLDVGMTVVSDNAKAYPEIQRLDGSLVSMNPATRGALNFIIATSFAYTVVETDRQNIENSQKQPLQYPRSVSMRVQDEAMYRIDPLELLKTAAVNEEALATIAA